MQRPNETVQQNKRLTKKKLLAVEQITMKLIEAEIAGTRYLAQVSESEQRGLSEKLECINRVMNRCKEMGIKPVSFNWLFVDIVATTLKPIVAQTCFGKTQIYWQRYRDNARRKDNVQKLDLVESIWKCTKENINCDAQIIEYSNRFHNGN